MIRVSVFNQRKGRKGGKATRTTEEKRIRDRDGDVGTLWGKSAVRARSSAIACKPFRNGASHVDHFQVIEWFETL